MTNTNCVVIDYGIGNTFSVMQALSACGVQAELTGDPQTIQNADRLILPGVGAFGRAAERLRGLGLDHEIKRFVDRGRPFLGICVGMQLLMDEGTEFGHHQGLGIIGGSVNKVDIKDNEGNEARVPLIGWYELASPEGEPSPWTATVLDSQRAGAAYYFVHSFAARPKDEHFVLAVVRHGEQNVVAAVQKENVIGVQFHPERSGPDGAALLNRFAAL